MLATRTMRDGTSAGVAVAAKTGILVGSIAGGFDHSPKASPGRLTAAWLHVGPDTGLVVFSIYLYHTELASLRNTALIRRAISIAREYGSPWVRLEILT